MNRVRKSQDLLRVLERKDQRLGNSETPVKRLTSLQNFIFILPNIPFFGK